MLHRKDTHNELPSLHATCTEIKKNTKHPRSLF